MQKITLFPTHFENIKKQIDEILDFKNTIIQFDMNIEHIIDEYVEVPELFISDHIDYFKELYFKGYQVEFYYDKNIFSLEKVLEDEDFLNRIAEEINQKFSSPFEKHVAIYSLVRNFKPYKKEESGMSIHESRSLYEYMNNSYFVCVGACNLMIHLHRLVGISSKYVGISPLEDFEGHMRVYFNLVDPKYHLNGYYVSDPTPNSHNSCFFRNMLMTDLENRMCFENCFFERVFSNYLNIDDLREDLSTEESIACFHYILKMIDPYFYQEFCQMDLDLEENLQSIFKYIQKKTTFAVYRKMDLLDAFLETRRKVYKDITEDEISKLKLSYISSSDDLKNDSECLSYLFDQVLSDISLMPIREIKEKFQVSSRDIFLYCAYKYYIVPFEQEYDYLLNVVLNKITWIHPNHDNLFVKRDYLESLGYIYQENSNGELLRIEFPEIVLNEEDTFLEYVQKIQKQQDEFLNLFPIKCDENNSFHI